MEHLKDFTKAISIILVILIVSIFTLECCSNKKLRQENERLSNNQMALSKELYEYRDRENYLIAEVQTLQVSKDEFMQIASEEAEEVKTLQKKVKYLQSYSEQRLVSEYKIDTVRLYDSVYIKDRVIDTVQCFDYADNYFQMYGCIKENRYTGEIKCFDTLIQTVERIPKKFLFIKYGTKGFKQSIKSKNPHSKITYAKYIEIKK